MILQIVQFATNRVQPGVSRSQTATLLGFEPNYTFRGFGEASPSLKEINAAPYDSILAAFTKTSEMIGQKCLDHLPTDR